MPKVSLTLHPVVEAITKIEKKLAKFRPLVSTKDKKIIDLELKDLRTIKTRLRSRCTGYVQTFPTP
jgi:hypothetical protein